MHTDNDYVIETRALSRRYGRKLALDHLDLRIPRGRIHAIVGANGAGKSTLFRILLGFLPQTSGQARILGRDSQQLTPQDRSRIGFVNEEHTLPGWMRVSAVIAMQRTHYPRWNQNAFDEVIGHYHVLPEQKIAQLSRGERAGFNLALALAQGPDLLVLDEPTLGLDVVAKRAFLESLLYSNAADDITVIYCSHQMEEIERVADQLIILERGKLVNQSEPEDFCARV
ncbi:MAG: ABC transporter ATP-binding protein, partial [Pseudomonadota bacterium]|nr:ABC transporter ATP-binding protein [Pseudomonadota bacterium]